jgi:Protein of unknown function (DUF3592)
MMKAMYLEKTFVWSDPSTWPWIVYVWLAFTAAGFAKPVWRLLRRNRAQGWSSVPGRIESVDATQLKALFFFTPSKDSSATHVAKLNYSYSMAGNSFAGSYYREFPTEWEARDFLRDLEGKTVTVLVDPDKPSSSTLSESSVETLLQTRPQVSEDAAVAGGSANSTLSRLTPFLWVFLTLSGVGFLLSLSANIGSLMGRRVLPGAFFFILHAGVFAVWFPAFFVAKKKVGNTHRKDFWKLVLRGAPDWMRYSLYTVFFYGFVGFFISVANARAGGSQLEFLPWRQFSTVWMIFYAAAFAILYASSFEPYIGERCINGHPVLPGASFCTQCGQPVRRSPLKSS